MKTWGTWGSNRSIRGSLLKFVQVFVCIFSSSAGAQSVAQPVVLEEDQSFSALYEVCFRNRWSGPNSSQALFQVRWACVLVDSQMQVRVTALATPLCMGAGTRSLADDEVAPENLPSVGRDAGSGAVSQVAAGPRCIVEPALMGAAGRSGPTPRGRFLLSSQVWRMAPTVSGDWQGLAQRLTQSLMGAQYRVRTLATAGPAAWGRGNAAAQFGIEMSFFPVGFENTRNQFLTVYGVEGTQATAFPMEEGARRNVENLAAFWGGWMETVLEQENVRRSQWTQWPQLSGSSVTQPMNPRGDAQQSAVTPTSVSSEPVVPRIGVTSLQETNSSLETSSAATSTRVFSLGEDRVEDRPVQRLESGAPRSPGRGDYAVDLRPVTEDPQSISGDLELDGLEAALGTGAASSRGRRVTSTTVGGDRGRTAPGRSSVVRPRRR